MIDGDRPPFAGFGPGATKYFDGLIADNSRDYFQAHKALWQTDVQDPLADLLGEVAVAQGGTVRLFRPWRDVRFSKDKRPVKEATGGYVWREGTLGVAYAQLSAAGLYCGTGLYDAAPDQLTRMREAVADDRTGPALEAAVEKVRRAGLDAGGDALATAPRGYLRDHPRVSLLRLKQLIVGRTLPPGPDLHDRRAMAFALKTWKAAAPVVAWLDAHVGPSAVSPEERYGRGRSR